MIEETAGSSSATGSQLSHLAICHPGSRYDHWDVLPGHNGSRYAVLSDRASHWYFPEIFVRHLSVNLDIKTIIQGNVLTGIGTRIVQNLVAILGEKPPAVATDGRFGGKRWKEGRFCPPFVRDSLYLNVHE